tara:strand:- start:590 stop:937 length:348 start_codon:yes stop_codon:yes gene_type:complete
VLVVDDVGIGENSWCSPNVFPCGGSGLEIGDYCSISAGVQIYSHHTVEWALSLGEEEPEETPTKIGSGVYIGPQSIVQIGVTVRNQTVIGVMSFVNCDIPSAVRVWGVPVRIEEM